jgi:hypothetical protein
VGTPWRALAAAPVRATLHGAEHDLDHQPDDRQVGDHLHRHDHAGHLGHQGRVKVVELRL